MKNKRFWINLGLYTAIILGLLYFYFPFSSSGSGQPASTVQFIYQQF